MDAKDVVICFVTLLVITACLLIVHSISYRAGYEACAKDFYKGKMKVDLVEKSDGTKEWEWVK